MIYDGQHHKPREILYFTYTFLVPSPPQNYFQSMNSLYVEPIKECKVELRERTGRVWSPRTLNDTICVYISSSNV